MLLGLNNNNRKNYYEITTKTVKSRLKNLDGKANGVITLFIWKLNSYEIIAKPVKSRLKI